MGKMDLIDAKSVQMFKSDRLGVRYTDEKGTRGFLVALAYEIVAIARDGSVHAYGVDKGGIVDYSEVCAQDCIVLNEVIEGDVDELLEVCLDEEERKSDINVYGFYEDLLAYAEKCPGTVFCGRVIRYIQNKMFEYGEKVRLKE